MNLEAIKTAATQGFGRTVLIGKKYSPEILTTIGIIGVVVAGVMAARATLKLEPIVDKVQDGLNTTNELKKSIALEHSADTKVKNNVDHYSQEDYIKDKTEVYVRGTVEIIKLYGPSISLAVVSIGCILASHGIMRSRNATLVAAYNVLEKSFASYRNRVVEEYGPEKDEEYRSGTRRVKDVDFESGKEVERVVKDPNSYSQYAKFFDESNVNWVKNNEYNLIFLKAQQQYANDMLKARGHVFLNDVYDSLGIERTSAGSVVGWVVRKSGGDNFIDFGMYDENSERARAFINGNERSIFLDFNVDGVIYDLI